MQNSRIVVLDCETSTISHGREPTCRYYMQKCVVKDTACTEQERNTKVYKILDEILKTCLGEIKQEFHYTFDGLKLRMGTIQQKSFAGHNFDDGFTIFWKKLAQLHHDHPDTPKHEDAYKNEFTKHALKIMSTPMPWGSYAWKFIQHGQEQHFYYDQPVAEHYEHAEGTTIIPFDIENKFHRDEVVRVCFGPHILSIGILQFDIQGNELQIVKDQHQENPYYQEFRQTPHYVHSTYVQQIHHLTASQLKQSIHNISSLHEKLQSILDTNRKKNVTFVAHNAQQDRKWILQSIDDQVKYHEYLSCKNGSDQKLHIESLQKLEQLLKNQWSKRDKVQRKWFCTLNGSMKDDGTTSGFQNGAKGKMTGAKEYTLDALYQFITTKKLTGYHNALTDTYACALIFCELLKISYPSSNNLERSSGYKRILDGCSVNNDGQKPTKTRRSMSLAETGRLTGRVFSHKKDMILRQYDIIIDTHILPPTFVTDENTQIGENIFLEFGGNYGEEHLNNTIVLNTGSGIRSRQHRLDQSTDPIFGNLGGACIEFQLKDDTDGRRVEINTSCNYLLWGTHRDLLQDDLFPDQKYRIDWDTPYYLYELHTQQTMCLLVKDRVPRASINSEQTSSQFTETARLLMTLQSLCL